MRSHVDHPDTYYAATANDQTTYEPLRGDTHADVCVVGAGFTGLSTALHLAERGYDVCVLEAHRVGWGASGRNGGQLIGGIAGEARLARKLGREFEDTLWELRWAGHDIIRDRIRQYGIDCDLTFGYVDVGFRQRHLRQFEREFDRLQQRGYAHEHRLLSGAETRELLGTYAYVGGLLNMGNGHLHPLNLCKGEARAATLRGARIHEQSPVVDIARGNRPRVVTASGSVAADIVVIAGNAYHALDRSLRSVMLPVNSFIAATEPLDEATAARINPRDLAVCDANFVLNYYRLSADRRLLFGARLNYFGNDPAAIARRQRRLIRRLYPELADVPIDFAWGGRLGVPWRRAPVIGRVAPNIFFSQGYAGHGVNVTHVAGQLLADAVSGTMERFDLLARVKPVRIPGAHRLATPLVSLAVLYYQLRDRL